jgi:hypothetical protein
VTFNDWHTLGGGQVIVNSEMFIYKKKQAVRVVANRHRILELGPGALLQE